MNHYEVTFIVDPVLSGDEINATAQTYVDQLQKEGCKIVHVDEMGLKQLAYPLKKRTTGVYYCIEFSSPHGNIIDKLELAFRRDERIMRFLTVKLDKYGVKYNDDKRKGLIGKRKTEDKAKEEPAGKSRGRSGGSRSAPRRTEKAPAPTPSPAPAPEAAAAVAEEKAPAPAVTEEEE